VGWSFDDDTLLIVPSASTLDCLLTLLTFDKIEVVMYLQLLSVHFSAPFYGARIICHTSYGLSTPFESNLANRKRFIFFAKANIQGEDD